MPTTTSVRRALVAVVASAVALAAAAVPAVAAPHTASVGRAGSLRLDDSARLAYQKDVAVRVLKGVFEKGDVSVVDRYVRSDYIQHNPGAADGSEALKNVGTALHQQFPDLKYEVQRVTSEGDLVLVHSNVVLTPGSRGSAVFDIFRFQGGKIAEHWDTIQDVPETTANGNGMFSTLSRPQTQEPTQHLLTEDNKKLVVKAFDELIVGKDVSAIDRYFGPEYKEHSANSTDGVAGVKAALGGFFTAYPQLEVQPKRVIAEGDLVAVHSHYIPAPGERGLAIVDLFRVRGGKIVEHWDVIQNVPATSANDNTMF
ncbi:nuclear transport factor 2 family protein [Streptomyces sp. NPDC013178]|uniref:nuclear transport factor 2 family protein n=1 Tax=Streptomyces sp. NPDC013178 TaxID=3155118 RepID=UPI003400C84A